MLSFNSFCTSGAGHTMALEYPPGKHRNLMVATWLSVRQGQMHEAEGGNASI